MTTNSAQQTFTSSDLGVVHTIVDRLIGKTCWQVRFSYGDELTLHFGDRVSYAQPSMANMEKGSWILGTRGTSWQLSRAPNCIVNSDATPEIMRENVLQIEGLALMALDINYPSLGLILTFGEQLQLSVLPSLEDDNYDLPYWELFTPEQYVLKVGSKLIWSYTRATASKT